MAKLEPRSDRTIFAPLIWRLAMKIEQVPWSEVAGSATDAVYVLRSAQRLFKQDIHCVWFDTWLEAEAAGLQVERDDLGVPIETPAPIDEWRSVDTVLAAEPVARAVEILRRLALDAGQDVIPVATLTGGATLHKRLTGTSGPADADKLDYVRQILSGLTRLYCEAGAGALLLLEEETATGQPALTDFASLFNLADYFATPVFVLNRGQASQSAIAAADSLGARYVTPDRSSEGIIALPVSGEAESSGWIALSRWEIDPETDPNIVQSWRQKLLRN